MKVLAAAKKSGFTVNLWLENTQNYYRTISELEISMPGLKLPGLRLRNFIELRQGMRTDPFYLESFKKGLTRLKFFDTYMLREMAGLKNLAAAADIYRLEILRQEGGVYFDVDTEFPIDSEDYLIPILLRDSFGIHQAEKGREVFHEGKMQSGKLSIYTNDFMAFIPHHPILSKTIDAIFRKFDKLDHVTQLDQNAHPGSTLTFYFSNLMDVKRSYIKKRSNQFDMKVSKDKKYVSAMEGLDRRSLTLEVSCTPLRIESSKYCHSESPLISGGFPFMINRLEHHAKKQFFDAQVLGIKVAHGSDQTWTHKPKKTSTSFDDSVLYSSSIRGLLGRKK